MRAEDYRRIPVEVTGRGFVLIGDVAEAKGEPALHIHAVLGRSDGSVVGGHLPRRPCKPTLRCFETAAKAHLERLGQFGHGGSPEASRARIPGVSDRRSAEKVGSVGSAFVIKRSVN